MTTPSRFDTGLLDVLACPCEDHGQLTLTTDGQLTCQVCQRTYRIEDGIPVLLIEEAQLHTKKTAPKEAA